MLTTTGITVQPGMQPQTLFVPEFFTGKMWKTWGKWNKLLLTDSILDFSTEHYAIK